MVVFLCSPGLDETQRLPRLHHVVQAGAAGSPGVPTQILALPDPGRSPEHQELQVSALAEPPELQQVSGGWCPVLGVMEVTDDLESELHF